MWNADKLGYRGNTNYNRAYEGDELVWEKQQPGPVGPPNDELWYTSIDGNIVTPDLVSALPTIVSNTYVDGKGIIKCATDITNVGSEAFRQRYALTSIEMPNSVTGIGNGAFYALRDLFSVTIPNSVTSIGNFAFWGCSRELISITIPNSVTSIGREAFEYCRVLTTVKYTGTKAQWKNISKGANWHKNVPATVVHCTDGDTPI